MSDVLAITSVGKSYFSILAVKYSGWFNSLAVRFRGHREQNVVIVSTEASFALFCLVLCSSGFVPWEVH